MKKEDLFLPSSFNIFPYSRALKLVIPLLHEDALNFSACNHSVSVFGEIKRSLIQNWQLVSVENKIWEQVSSMSCTPWPD
jgi:hypothetical protein